MNKNDIVVALAGNPNCGKTSLFNFITGSNQHVGNYPGVTVERKEGSVNVDDARVTFVDLPGTYSLSPYTLEESVARKELLLPEISGVIVVLDSTRLERNLYLVSQIIEMGKPVVIALNMFDEFESSGNTLDVGQLSTILGVPCVKTVGSRGKGVTELMATVLKAVRGELPAIGHPPRYSHEMEHAIDSVMELVGGLTPYNERWAAVNMLTFGETYDSSKIKPLIEKEIFDKIALLRIKLEEIEGRTVHNIVTAGRYGFSSGAVAECLTEKEHVPKTTTEKIDMVMTNRLLGFPIFIFVLWSMFQATFTLGSIPMDLIDKFVGIVSNVAEVVLPDGFIESLVVDGIIAGVGGVIVFLPNIMILFFFISILEDTGYMARAAFIMDKVMHFFGMHGKSFLPMLVGFGCTVPAIMATRILENRKDRLITMFILPFMSCGARLPVYILLAGAFFSPGKAGNVIFSIYLIGIALSLIVARLLNFSQGTSTPFVMELPPYRIPTMRSVLIHIWERAFLYLKKAGTTILVASVILWFLMSYPKLPESSQDTTSPGQTEMGVRLEQSYAGKFGKFIEPVFRPLGFDWRTCLALTAGFSAKEVIVSTYGTIYSIGENETGDTDTSSLKIALRDDPTLNPVKAYGLMLFILIYIPCFAVLGILRREAGGLKWVVIMVLYTTILAWLVSFSFIKAAELIL